MVETPKVLTRLQFVVFLLKLLGKKIRYYNDLFACFNIFFMKVEINICVTVCSGSLLPVDARLHFSALLLGVKCFNFFEK